MVFSGLYFCLLSAGFDSGLASALAFVAFGLASALALVVFGLAFALVALAFSSVLSAFFALGFFSLEMFYVPP